jgi:hypothetical protein
MQPILDEIVARADAADHSFKEWLHQRVPKGHSAGGQFTSSAAKAEVASVGTSIKKTKDRAWSGKQAAQKKSKPLSKQQSGLIGENVAVAYSKALGFEDAKPVPDAITQHIDLIRDHELIEVKTGLVHNASSHYWMTKIGEPGKEEKKWLERASKAAKAKHNAIKQAKILRDKRKMLKEAQSVTGKKFNGRMICILLDLDRRIADIHLIKDSFHQYVGWNSELAKKSYVGSYSFR